MSRSRKGLEVAKNTVHSTVGPLGGRWVIGGGGLSVLVGILCLLTIPVTPVAAITSSSGHGHAFAQSTNVTSVSATGLGPAELGVAEAVLTGVGASSIPLTVSVGSPVLLPTTSGAEYSVTTVIGMGQGIGSALSAVFTGPQCGADGSLSVYQCTTMYYNIKSDTNNFFADDHQDSIQAVNYDPHDAVLSSLSLTAGGSGIQCNGSGSLAGGHTWNIGSPASGTTYYETPSWSGNYYRLDGLLGNFQNVQGTLYWYYRGNPETLTWTYTLPDSESSWPTGGCSN